MRVLVIGDVMVDIAARLSGPIVLGSDRRAEISVRPGGSAATQAVWLAKSGLQVDFVGRIGAADLHREADILRAAGVTPHLAADPKLETGRLVAIVDPSGERSFLTDRGANDALCEADIAPELIEAADHIHISGYALLSPVSRTAVASVLARLRGKPASVDPGSAGFLREIGARTFLDAVSGVDILFPNADEAAVLAGGEDRQAQREELARLFPLVVVKRGGAGAEAWSAKKTWRVDAPSARVVDTTGAGDAFAAAFLAARLGGHDVETCLVRAVAAGSAATEFLGGRPQRA